MFIEDSDLVLTKVYEENVCTEARYIKKGLGYLELKTVIEGDDREGTETMYLQGRKFLSTHYKAINDEPDYDFDYEIHNVPDFMDAVSELRQPTQFTDVKITT